MPEYIISVLGGVVQDLTTITDRLPHDGETFPASRFTMQPGGKGSNSAVAIHRLTRPNPRNQQQYDDTKDAPGTRENDIKVRMVGVVGDDKFGPALIENLEKCGVNKDGVRIMEGYDTAVANILVESESGANRIMQYPGAASHVSPDDFTTGESLGGGVVPHMMVAQLELHRDAVEQAIETASRVGVEVLLNPSPAHFLFPDIYCNVSHLVMNETEAFVLAERKDEDTTTFSDWTSIADYFHGLGVKNVVITLGEKGAYYSTKKGEKMQNGYAEAEKECYVFDTSGAGYVFPFCGVFDPGADTACAEIASSVGTCPSI